MQPLALYLMSSAQIQEHSAIMVYVLPKAGLPLIHKAHQFANGFLMTLSFISNFGISKANGKIAPVAKSRNINRYLCSINNAITAIAAQTIVPAIGIDTERFEDCSNSFR